MYRLGDGDDITSILLLGTGCGQYRSSPYCLVVKHMDRKIAVKDFLGVIALILTTRIKSYFHPLMAHVQKKNPFFDGTVRINRSLHVSLDLGQHQVLAFLDLEVNIT